MESAFADGPQQHLVIYHCIACDMLVLLAERRFSPGAVSDLGDGISRGHDADREGDPVEPHSESLSVLFHDASAVSLRGKGASRRSQFFETDIVFSCGIIMAALSARQIAAYPNISQYIKVDSYLKTRGFPAIIVIQLLFCAYYRLPRRRPAAYEQGTAAQPADRLDRRYDGSFSTVGCSQPRNLSWSSWPACFLSGFRSCSPEVM